GACGYGEYGRTVNSGAFCGVSKLYSNGTSCGACYHVKCKHPEYCNEEGTDVVVTDSGEENAEFILSFSAYAKLAKPLMVAKLVAEGEVDIEYQRVPCKYATGAHLMVKVHESSKFPNYLAIVLLNKGGLSDITAIEVWEESHKQWKSMVRIFGAVWAVSDPPKGALKCRFQVRGSAGVHEGGHLEECRDFSYCRRFKVEEVRQAVRRMRRGRATGPDEIPVEFWKFVGEAGLRWLTGLFNEIFKTAKMPEAWRWSTMIPLYKNKGDIQSCNNYRGLSY
ncbi:Expansin-like B1, partial [Capsicum annuum]